MWLLDLSLVEVLLVVAVYWFAAVVQSSAGFGSAVIAGPFLALIDPRFVPGPLLLAGLVMAILIMLRDGLYGRPRDIALLTTGRLVGSLLGAFLLIHLSQNSLSAVFASLLLIAAMTSAIGLTIKQTLRSISMIGITSGMMSVVAGLGGAPVALAFHAEQGQKRRALLATYLFPGGILSLITVTIAGRLTLYDFELFLLLLPGLALGHQVSTSLKSYVDRYVSKWVVLGITVTGSGWLLVKTLFLE